MSVKLYYGFSRERFSITFWLYVEIITLRLGIVWKIISYYSKVKYVFGYNSSLLHH